jgi:hypothetical protein
MRGEGIASNEVDQKDLYQPQAVEYALDQSLDWKPSGGANYWTEDVPWPRKR